MNNTSSSSSSSSFNFLLLLFLFCTSCVSVNGIGDKFSINPLYEDTPMHCDELIDMHHWEGTCCSLNVTEGNGCILNVRDGYCVVRGEVWTLNYESTSDIPCPPSEYSNERLRIKVPGNTQTLPTEEVKESGGVVVGGPRGTNNNNAVTGLLFSITVVATVAASIIAL
jgi:hypothetical protein